MKAWAIYWAEKPKGVDEKHYGSTTVVSDDIVSATILFIDRFPDRKVSSISSETDDVLFDD